MLRINPAERYTVDDIKRDPWFNTYALVFDEIAADDLTCSGRPNELIEKQRSNAKLNRPPTVVWDSLPTPQYADRSDCELDVYFSSFCILGRSSSSSDILISFIE